MDNPDLRDELERKVREAYDIPIIERNPEDAGAITPIAKPSKKK
jgi:recombination protein RecA